VVLALVYYECPMLCTQVLNGLVTALGVMSFDVGREFDVVAVSISPREGPGLASQKKAAYLQRYGRPHTADGWHFLTGTEESIEALSRRGRLPLRLRRAIKQYAHGGGHRGADAEGVIAKYLLRRRVLGARPAPRLVEAADERSAPRSTRFLLFCYHYDPATGKLQRRRPAPRAPGRVATVLVFLSFLAVSLSASAGPDRRPRRADLTMNRTLPLFPARASTVQAGEVDALFFFMVAVTAFFAFLIAAHRLLRVPLPAAARRDERPQGDPRLAGARAHLDDHSLRHRHGDVRLGRQGVLRPVPRPGRRHEIFVVGKQWMWKVQHMTGQSEINELHVPARPPVRLMMGSEDVIHSFYVPAFRVKAGRPAGPLHTRLWFEATKPGTYHLFCAEYCGTEHSGMIGNVIVLEPAEYQAWLDGGPRRPVARRGGRAVHRSRVRVCHGLTRPAAARAPAGRLYGPGRAAQRATVLADEDYIRESIVNPQRRSSLGSSR
jgi:cytochrome c oxidase subunit II